MNKNVRSSFENAMSVLNNAKKFGLRVRFVLNRATVGTFTLDGRVEEVSDKRFQFRGEGCVALVDWESATLNTVEDLGASPEFSFSWCFRLEGDDFFVVVGLDPFPTGPTRLLN